MGEIKPKKYYFLCFVFAYILIYISDVFGIRSGGRRILTGNSSSTDCTQEQTTETGDPLFASLIRIDHPSFLIAAVAITIFIVTTVETVFSLLMKMTEGSPYTKMVDLIEAELMNVGFTALLFKVIFNNTHFLNHEWFFALELADVVVPFYVFCSCSTGLILVIAAMKQTFLWSRAFHLQLEEILNEFYHAKTKTRSWMIYFAPLSKVMCQVEFRVLNILFCEAHLINRSVPFDEYIAIVLEKSILSLIETRPVDWIILICALCIVLLVMSSWTGNASFYGAHCDAADLTCLDQKAVELFIILGIILFLLTCFVAVVSRMYETRLLRISGANSESDYPEYLMRINTEMGNNEKSEKVIGDDQLLLSLKNIKEKRKHRQNHTFSYYIGVYPSLFFKRVQSLIVREKKIIPHIVEDLRNISGNSVKDFIAEAHAPKANGSASQKKSLQYADNNGYSGGSSSRENVDPSYENNHSNSDHVDGVRDHEYNEVHQYDNMTCSPQTDVTPNTAATAAAATISEIEDSSPVPMSIRHSRGRSSMLEKDYVEGFSLTNSDQPSVFDVIKQKKLLLQVFLFERPDVYFEVVKTLLMVISAYNAFWLVNFLSISKSGWKLLTVLPGFLSVLVFTYIVKAAAVLKATYVVDNDALLEVLEQAESAEQLAGEIRQKLLKKLAIGEDPISKLYELFHEIDGDGSDELSRLEFEDLLLEFGLTFSKKKLRQLFHHLDRNFDDSISFKEFFIFLFPDHVAAKKMEMERLEAIASSTQEWMRDVKVHEDDLQSVN